MNILTRIAATLAVFASLTAASSAVGVPAAATKATPAPAKPAAPCTFTSGPADLQTRWAELGGARSFGCFVRQLSNGAYEFGSGQMMEIPSYGPGGTLAAYVDPGQLIHLYWATPYGGFDAWLVRLSYNGVLVNQQTYGNGVIVHPGGRHGALQVAVEGVYTFSGLHASETTNGWTELTFNL
jgi:hypothetical protein